MNAAAGTCTAAPAPTTSLGRQYATYMLGVLLQKVGAFVLIPLYTARLSTADYGTLEMLGTLVNLLALFVVLGVPGALNKCYHRDCASERERQELVGTCLLFTLAWTVLLAAAALTLDRTLAVLLFGRPGWALYVRIAILSLALMQLASIPLELLRTLGRAGLYVGLSLMQLLVHIAACVLLLVRLDLGPAAVLTGTACGHAVVLLLGTAVVARHAVPRLRWHSLRPLVGFGLVLIPIGACGWVMNLSDRFFLQHLASESEVGLYGLGYKFGTLVELLVVLPFQKAWNPYFMARADQPEARELLSRVLTYYALLIALAAAAIAVCGASAVRLLAHPDFHPAARVIPLVAAGYGLSGLVMCLSTGLIVTGKARIVAAIAVAGGAANLLLNAGLIPRFGMMGAGFATLLTFGFTTTLSFAAVRRWYPIRPETARLLAVLAITAVPAGLASAVHLDNAALELFLRGAIVCCLPLALLAGGFASAEDRSLVRQLFTPDRAPGVPAPELRSA